MDIFICRLCSALYGNRVSRCNCGIEGTVIPAEAGISLETIRELPTRRCQNPSCGADISHMTRRAIACSAPCRSAIHKMRREGTWVGEPRPQRLDVTHRLKIRDNLRRFYEEKEVPLDKRPPTPRHPTLDDVIQTLIICDEYQVHPKPNFAAQLHDVASLRSYISWRQGQPWASTNADLMLYVSRLLPGGDLSKWLKGERDHVPHTSELPQPTQPTQHEQHNRLCILCDCAFTSAAATDICPDCAGGDEP